MKTHTVELVGKSGEPWYLSCYDHSDESIITKVKDYYEDYYHIHATVRNAKRQVVYESPFESTFISVKATLIEKGVY